MNVEITTFRCTKCGQQAKVSRPELQRRLDTALVPAWVTFCWCRKEATLTPAEGIPSLESLRESRDFVAAELAQGNRGVLDYDLPPDQYDLLIPWRAQRVSPPRCLSCGSTDIDLLESPPGGGPGRLEHPGCGGNWEVINLDFEDRPGAQAMIVDAEGRVTT